MGPGIGEGDMALGIADQPADGFLVAVEQLGGEEGAEILLEAEIEEPVKRMSAGRFGQRRDRLALESAMRGIGDLDDLQAGCLQAANRLAPQRPGSEARADDPEDRSQRRTRAATASTDRSRSPRPIAGGPRSAGSSGPRSIVPPRTCRRRYRAPPSRPETRRRDRARQENRRATSSRPRRCSRDQGCRSRWPRRRLPSSSRAAPEGNIQPRSRWQESRARPKFGGFNEQDDIT